MGHIRLGRLPRRLKWQAVIDLLGESHAEGAATARVTMEAAEGYLLSLRENLALNYCFWLLTRVTWAARGENFLADLGSLGLNVSVETPTVGFIAAVSDRVREQAMQDPAAGSTAETAALSIRRALTETVGRQSASLFGSNVEDLQRALQTYSTRDQFGRLSQLFFGDFLARTLQSYVDREIPNLVGASPGIQTVGESREAVDAIERHARETAFILRDFAGGWYSRNQWISRGDVSQDDTQRFVAYALRKMREELKREASA